MGRVDAGREMRCSGLRGASVTGCVQVHPAGVVVAGR